MMSRLFAVVVVLAAVVCVSGSSLDFASPSSLFSADSWPSPSEMSLPLASSLIDEVNARHREFLMVEGATGATGPGGLTGATGVSSSGAWSSSGAGAASSSGAGAGAASSSGAGSAASSSGAGTSASTGVTQASSSSGAHASSTGATIDRSLYSKVVVITRLNFTRVTVPLNIDSLFCGAVAASTNFLNPLFPNRAIECSHQFLLASGEIISGRRLLEVTDETLKMSTTFYPENDDDTTASASSTSFVAQVMCQDKYESGIIVETRSQCITKNLVHPGGSSLIDQLNAIPNIGGDMVNAIFTGPDAVTVITTPGTIASASTPSEGTARSTNAGYYVLGAVLLAFLFGAIIYFTVHKAPVVKEVDIVDRRAGSVAMQEMHPAVPATAGSALVPAGEDAGQMDYKSVFALKHNVLDKRDAAADEPADDNDVHFVLHQ